MLKLLGHMVSRARRAVDARGRRWGRCWLRYGPVIPRLKSRHVVVMGPPRPNEYDEGFYGKNGS